MKGAAYMGEGRLTTVSTDVAPPGPGELQIAVAYAGCAAPTCTSSTATWTPGSGRPWSSAMR